MKNKCLVWINFKELIVMWAFTLFHEGKKKIFEK